LARSARLNTREPLDPADFVSDFAAGLLRLRVVVVFGAALDALCDVAFDGDLEVERPPEAVLVEALLPSTAGFCADCVDEDFAAAVEDFVVGVLVAAVVAFFRVEVFGGAASVVEGVEALARGLREDATTGASSVAAALVAFGALLRAEVAAVAAAALVVRAVVRVVLVELCGAAWAGVLAAVFAVRERVDFAEVVAVDLRARVAAVCAAVVATAAPAARFAVVRVRVGFEAVAGVLAETPVKPGTACTPTTC
jgi:hypothetical protein